MIVLPWGDEERPVDEWDWGAIRAVEAHHRRRIWDRNRYPRCAECDRPMVARQVGTHLVCAPERGL